MTRGRKSFVARLIGVAIAFTATLGVAACDKTYDFGGVTVGQDNASRTPQARSNAQYIRGIYADVLGRAPEAYDFVVTDGTGAELARFPVDEQQMLVDALDGINDPDALRALIATGLVNSPEAGYPEKTEVSDPAAFITEQFQALLGRDPSTYELAAFVAEWKKDAAVSPRTVARALIASREYQSQ